MSTRIRKVTAVHFSPTGNARKIACAIAERIGAKLSVPVEKDDFTLPADRMMERTYKSNELVVFCVPVFAGRIPNKILPAVQSLFKGKRTCVVPVVTFGNRSYDNALKELCFELDKNGFLSVGAAAVVAEHSFSDQLAPGRPNAEDMAELERFADGMADKFLYKRVVNNADNYTATESKNIKKEFDQCPVDINNIFIDIDTIPGQWPVEQYYTPLGVDGQPAKFLKAKPKTREEACIECGICAEGCPMGAIDEDEPMVVTGTCIKCQACVKECPQCAKYFEDEAFLSHVKMLEENYVRRAESFFQV